MKDELQIILILQTEREREREVLFSPNVGCMLCSGLNEMKLQRKVISLNQLCPECSIIGKAW